MRNQISSERATTLRHRAGLKGEPIGEPRIWWKTAVPIENWVISRDARTDDGLNVADVDLAGDVQSATGSTFDHIPVLVARGGFH